MPFNTIFKTTVVLLTITDVVLLTIAEKPSTSIPQKRPSPNSNNHQQTSKRLTSYQQNCPGSRNESIIAKTTGDLCKIADKDESDGNIIVRDSAVDDDNLSIDNGSKEESFASCSQSEDYFNKSVPLPTNWSTLEEYDDFTGNLASMSVNSSLTSKEFIENFHTEWFESDKIVKKPMDDCKKPNHDNVKLYKKPFKICVISNFLEKGSFTQQMVDEMSNMEWHRKQMDLYEFHQTTDLANLPPNAKPALTRFYNMLQNDMLPWMKQVTGLPLTRISASCSMYNYGDYLLVHDDLLSDRQIAFVFYISPWFHDWTDEMGGALELFETDALTGQPKYPIVQKFHPRNNQFVFFRVCKQSFHQVGEVTNLVFPRLTINGWFHGLSTPEHENSISEAVDESDLETSNSDEYSPPVLDDLDLNEWINPCYLKKKIKHGIQQHIEDKSEASLEIFLISDFFDLLVSELKDNTGLNWVLEGPANQRKYESLHFTPQSTGPLKDLYTLFTSESIFNLLHEYTELDLDAGNPTCSVQICRFGSGCYTLLGDSSTFADSALDIILFFNVRNGVGKITYLSPSQCDNEYNTTSDTDGMTSSMDISGVATSDNSLCSATNKSISNTSKNSKYAKHKIQTHSNQHKNSSGSSNTTKGFETSEEETSVGELSEYATLVSIMKNVDAINATCVTNKMEVRATVHGNNESNNFDYDSEMISDDEEDSEELAQEDALLTIHPKDNSLNLVYRLSGQAKFVKYISKNNLQPDEYVYILFASYKE